MRRETARALRRVSWWALGIALLLLALIGGVNTIRLQLDYESTELERATEELRRLAGDWDGEVRRRARDWLTDLAGQTDRGARERYFRAQEPWFDTYFEWTSTPDGSPNFTFPARAAQENLPALNAAPCVAKAWREGTPEAFAACQSSPDPGLRLFAATQAATLLLAAGRADEAVHALESARVAETPLAQPSGLPPRRMAVQRLLHADALRIEGRDRLAAALYVELGQDIVGQDGPILEEVLPLLEAGVLEPLRQMGEAAAAERLAAEIPRLQRRLAAWKEVRDQLAPRATPSGEVQLFPDPYGGGFLLAYIALDDRRSAAIQLNEAPLIGSLAAGSGPAAEHLVVRDAGGRLLMGAKGEPRTPVAPELLAHLRLDFGPSYMDSTRAATRQTFLFQLAPIALGMLIGAAALLTRMAADRREQELLDRQREFVTRVTHELKTPLAGIRLMAENIEIGAARDEATRVRFAARIISEADKLTARIDEILAAARAEALTRKETFDLSVLIDEVLLEWDPRLADAKVLLHRDIERPLLMDGDRKLLRDALVCLVENALKYRKEGAPDSFVRVRARGKGDRVEIQVIDNGIGVPKDRREAIFEPFVRVEGPGRGKSGGHGLGLSFVAQAVEGHGGSVDCEDGIDGGCAFILRLPRKS